MNCSITVTVALIVILATTPVLSNLAVAQQEKFSLTATVKNWAACSIIRGCVGGPFIMTSVNSPFSGVHESFDAANCGPLSTHPCIGPTKTFEIIPGSTVTIHALGIPIFTGTGFFVPEVPHFTGDLPQCSNLNSDTCLFDMPASPVHIDVNYHFKFDGIGAGDVGDNSGDNP